MSDTVEQIHAILRSDPELTPQVADALCELIAVAYNQFAKRSGVNVDAETLGFDQGEPD